MIQSYAFMNIKGVLSCVTRKKYAFEDAQLLICES